MGLQPHNLLDILIGVGSLGLLIFLWHWAKGLAPKARSIARWTLITYAVWVCFGVLMSSVRFAWYFPNLVVVLVRGLHLLFALFLFYGFIVLGGLRRAKQFHPERRKMLNATAAVALAAPVAVCALAFIKRDELIFREVSIPIKGLPKALHGLRVVQLSDIHLSPLVSEDLLARAVDMANGTRAHIAVVTGDLVTRIGDPLDLCLKHLARLRSDAGTFGCMGNHEIYAEAESYTAEVGRQLGIQFLRSASQLLQFDGGAINLTGVDYQRKGKPYLRSAEHLVVPGATNVLLSHSPDVFKVAAKQGWDLTIAGHTHGGQINMEIIHPSLNVVRFSTPFVYGTYEIDGRALYVTRGVGTIGLPGRLNAPPEVALIHLCAT
jgi:predicted MPP superfamily phosphohydrolase